MKIIAVLLAVLFVSLVLFFLTRKREYLYYTKKGKLWLGFAGVAVITMMDELTSIFYAPGEAFRFIGYKSITYLSLTSLLIFLYSLTMTEIAEILENNKIKGGGVYSFSYFVFGATASFIAAGSIIVDYVNTAVMSSISAVENLNFFFHWPLVFKLGLELLIIWLIAGLNLVGAKENAKVTYALFAITAYVLTILAFLGISELDHTQISRVVSSYKTTLSQDFLTLDPLKTIELISIGFGSTILAYSGIESVLQTHKLVENWKTIYKAYIMLGLTVGIFTPLIGTLALARVENPLDHVDDLITYYSKLVGTNIMAIAIVILASLTLAFAVNTALVGATELISTMADNHKAYWISTTNRFHAHYRIIIFMSVFFSFIVLITQGNQDIVADMYAIGLIATFVINTGTIILYKIVRGNAQTKEYRTGIFRNLILFIVFLSTFIYIVIHKPYGTAMWTFVVLFFIIAGNIVTRIKTTEEEEKIAQIDKYADVIDYIGSLPKDKPIHIYFRRPSENVHEIGENMIYITFFFLRQKRPPKKLFKSHFILPVNAFWGIGYSSKKLLEDINNQYPDKIFNIHFGWPLSSWFERIFTGVMVYNILQMPKQFPNWNFFIEYRSGTYKPKK
ncbi:MAG: amino acid transporter [Hydrogenobaculum sp.]|nr:MAG: amino acid transporter [Hydrogenobaculum sp.]